MDGLVDGQHAPGMHLMLRLLALSVYFLVLPSSLESREAGMIREW